ncbi:MAG: response regulator [Alphaproteobacteria bacterium]|nr:response regulator [Alphaproteobacteria bacterium]
MLILINDILDFAKIESGKMELDPICLDLSLLIEDILDLFAIKAQEKALELLLDYKATTPRQVVGDPVRIRQVVSNLISNALKFTQQGYILITVDGGPAPDTSLPLDDFKITVTDTGTGIPLTMQQNIFDKFVQADASTTRLHGGSGLGLAISKQLVTMMNGTIGVESAVDKGSSFWFTMRLRRAAAPYDETQEVISFKGVRMLVVDDLPASAALIQRQLVEADASCDTCGTAREALMMIRQSIQDGLPYRVALVDDKLPQMNGADLAQIAATEWGAVPTAFILMTNALERSYAEMQAGPVAAVMNKPIYRGQMLSMVQDVWKRQQVVPQAAVSPQPMPAHPSPVYSTDFAGARILVAEDSQVGQEYLASILHGYGCEVTLVDTGSAVLQKALHESFDMIVMDCEMPIMNGCEAARLITAAKNRGACMDMPIVAFTANDSTDNVMKCYESGMIDILPKPLKREQVEDILRRWLKSQNTRREKSSDQPLANKRILIVEDNIVNMQFAVEVIEQLGCFVSTAADGAIAVQKIQNMLAGHEQYDAVLMDCHMPTMDGFQATVVIRDLLKDRGINLPIIALTALAMKDDRQRCLDSGMDDYLTKPLRKSELASMLTRWIIDGDLMTESRATRARGAPRVLNPDTLIEIRATMGDRFTNFVKVFVQDTKNRLFSVEQLLQTSSDMRAIYVHIHAIRSACAHLGAERMSTLAGEMEDGLLGPNKMEVGIEMEGDLGRLRTAFDDVMDALYDEKVFSDNRAGKP